ncbi:hypothetical protein ACFL0I_05770 [Gemmatimonadota bacterium]
MNWNEARIPILISLLALAGCTNAPRLPYPTDAELMDRFASQRETFERLAADPQDSMAMVALEITGSRVMPDSEVRFQVWYRDLFGPGGCTKGYAYLKEAPRTVVDSIGTRWETCPPEDAELYRKLEGEWYIFYTAVN